MARSAGHSEVHRFMRGVATAATLWLSGCASEPDPLNVEGIVLAEDGVFRQMVIEGVPAQQVYRAAQRVVRFYFAGVTLTEVPDELLLETAFRGASTKPIRARIFLRVDAVDDGSRIDIYAPLERLKDDTGDDPVSPWEPAGRDALLENLILSEIWNSLFTKLPGEFETESPQPRD